MAYFVNNSFEPETSENFGQNRSFAYVLIGLCALLVIWTCRAACGIFSPGQGLSVAGEVWSPDRWTTVELRSCLFLQEEFLICFRCYPLLRNIVWEYLLPFSRLPFHFDVGFLHCAEAF